LTSEQIQTRNIYIKSFSYFFGTVQGVKVSFDKLLKVDLSCPHIPMSVAGLSSCHSTCLFPCLYPTLCVFVPCLFSLFTLLVCSFACRLSVRQYDPLSAWHLSVPKYIPLSVFFSFCHPAFCTCPTICPLCPCLSLCQFLCQKSKLLSL
jgi:hypothetical protein